MSGPVTAVEILDLMRVQGFRGPRAEIVASEVASLVARREKGQDQTVRLRARVIDVVAQMEAWRPTPEWTLAAALLADPFLAFAVTVRAMAGLLRAAIDIPKETP